MPLGGGKVTGLDYLDKNIDVCKILLEEHDSYHINFINGNIENYVQDIAPDKFDLVLGLSVFHHLCYIYGKESAKELISELAIKISTGIFELAVKSEQIYWADSLPDDPEELLMGYDYVNRVSEFPTHLSDIKRPLYVASSRYAYFGEQVIMIDQVLKQSHKNNGNCFKGTRRYFLGEDLFIKRVKKFIPNEPCIGHRNCEEIENERAFLEEVGGKYGFPEIEYFDEDEDSAILVRKLFPGRLLSEIIDENEVFDEWDIIKQVLLTIIELEKAGFYYKDLRTWNLIYFDGKISFIDYGDIGREMIDCSWPYNVVLSFFIFIDEVLSKSIRVFPVRNVVTISCMTKWVEHGKIEEILKLNLSNHIFRDIYNVLFEMGGKRKYNNTIGISILESYESLFNFMLDDYKELVENREVLNEMLLERNEFKGRNAEELKRIVALEQCWIIRSAIKLGKFYRKFLDFFQLK